MAVKARAILFQEAFMNLSGSFEIVSRGCRQIEGKPLDPPFFVVPAKAGTSPAEARISAFIGTTGNLTTRRKVSLKF